MAEVKKGGSSAKVVETKVNKPANVPPATGFDPSGAPRQVVSDVDPSHPAVDHDPRADTSIAQNKIDFNDPTLSTEEAVQKNLDDQA